MVGRRQYLPLPSAGVGLIAPERTREASVASLGVVCREGGVFAMIGSIFDFGNNIELNGAVS